VDIELHQPFVSHFQQQRLASFLICNIGAFHDLVDLERLLAERAQDILSIVQHEQTPTVADICNLLRRLINLSKATRHERSDIQGSGPAMLLRRCDLRGLPVQHPSN
jgi:hypothetical protein